MPKEEAFNEPEDFFSKSPTEISRKYCEPSREIYTGSSELGNDPFKAIESVDWLGPSLTEISDPIEGLVVAAARLETAQRELHLAPKQRENFEGHKQNIDGAIGFLGALVSTLKSKAIRRVASGATVVTMALSAAGCGNAIARPIDEITPNISPATEVFTPTDSPESPTISPTITVFPNETSTPVEIWGAAYPKSAENFVKKPSISGAEARKIIVEKRVGEDLKALENWYKSKGIIGSGMSNVAVPVVYQEGGNFNWNLMVKKNNGNFLKFTITSGKEKDQLVRAMGMITYLGEKPSFEVSELKDPAGMENLTQQVIWDKSGWSVIGAFRGETLIGWFNADKNMWVMEQNPTLEVSPTPEQTEIHSSLEISGEVDGLPVNVTFSIAKDTYERGIKPLDRWEYNSAFVEKYGEKEAKNLMAGIIMKAHFFAWQEDDWENRKNINLSDFVQRIKNGEDMSYEIYASDRDSIVQGEKKMVNPAKPVEIIFSEKRGGNMGVNPIDKASFLLYSDSGSLTIELFGDPAYMEIDHLPKDDAGVTDALWGGAANGLYLIAYDIRHQIPGSVSSGDMGAYQMWVATNRPNQDQLYMDFYKYINDEDPSLTPIRVRER